MGGGGGGGASSESLFPGEYLSLSLGGSGEGDLSFSGDFLGEGDLELDLDLLSRFLAGRSGDLSEAELESRDLDCFLGAGEADLPLALLALPDLLLDFFLGDSFFGSGDFDADPDRSDSDPDLSSFFLGDPAALSGESSFLAKFLRFTGEAELSDEEDCFLFARFVFFFLFLLPSDDDPLKRENKATSSVQPL